MKISPDETFAVVRTASIPATGLPQNVRGWTYLLDLTVPGAPIRLDVSHPCAWNSSDFVEVIDDYVVASTWMGTGSTSRDLLIMPKTATSLSQVTLDNTPENAPDVAVGYHPTLLTPYAAVRGTHGVTLWDLATGNLIQSDSFVVTPCGGGGGSYGAAIGCSDSIVMSGSRYAAISNFQYPLAPPGSTFERSSAVAIGALAGPTSAFPVIHQLTGTQIPQGGPCTLAEHVLHDLAMSPDGRFTVVTGTRTFAIYRNRGGLLADLRSMPQHPELPTPRFIVQPAEWQTTDSVEASNRHAVFIGNAAPFTEVPILAGTPDTDSFRVTIADFDRTVPLYWDYLPTDVGLTLGTPSRVHDLAITPNGSAAAVTTRAGLLLFELAVSDPQNPQRIPVKFFSSAPDPLRFGMNIPPAPPQQVPVENSGIVLCSDSVLCTDSAVVTIGRGRTPSPRGEVFMLNLADRSSVTFDLGPDHIPTDLDVTPSGATVIVRSIHRVARLSGQNSRLTVLSIPSGLLLMDLDSSPALPVAEFGHAFGRDQVSAGNAFVVTAGENFPWTENSGTFPLNATGFVQVLKLQ